MNRGTLFAVIGLIIAAGSLAVGILQLQSPVRLQTPDERPDLLDKLFKAKTLQSNREYVEAITGPAIAKEAAKRAYNVGGCDVEVFYSGEDVAGLGLRVSPTCTFRWQDIVPGLGAVPPPHQMHFADVMDHGDYTLWIDCISLCGNAAEPEGAKIEVGGSHAMNWGYVMLQAEDGEQNAKAFAQIDALAKQNGQEFGLVAPVCSTDTAWIDPSIVRQFVVTRIVIGGAQICADREK